MGQAGARRRGRAAVKVRWPRLDPKTLSISRATMLISEGQPCVGIPGEFRNPLGQLTLFAPCSHRNFRRPTELLRFERERHGDAAAVEDKEYHFSWVR